MVNLRSQLLQIFQALCSSINETEFDSKTKFNISINILEYLDFAEQYNPPYFKVN